MRARAFLMYGQTLDAVSFALFVTLAPAALIVALREIERNPVVVALFAIGGVAAVVFAKLGLTYWAIGRDRARTGPRPKVTGALMIAAGLTGYVGAVANLVALWTVLG